MYDGMSKRELKKHLEDLYELYELMGNEWVMEEINEIEDYLLELE